jgi:hypothetical protein
LDRVLTRSLGPSSIPSLSDGVTLGTAWNLSAAWKRGHAQAAASRIIISVAHRIHQGAMPDLSAPARKSDFYFVPAEEPETAVQRILELVKTRIPKRFGLDPIRDIQVLCPRNSGGVGALSLNIELQAALNPASERKVGVWPNREQRVVAGLGAVGAAIRISRRVDQIAERFGRLGRHSSGCHRLERPLMTPFRTTAVVVLFTLAALSAVATFVESYNLGEGLWASRAAVVRILMGVGHDDAGVDRESFAPTIRSLMQRATTVSNSFRNRSLSRKRPWRLLENVE